MRSHQYRMARRQMLMTVVVCVASIVITALVFLPKSHANQHHSVAPSTCQQSAGESCSSR